MRALIIAGALTLAGCNIMHLAQEYSSSPATIVPVKIERSLITAVGVQIHPTDANRAYVTARSGVADESWKNGNTEWIARLDEFRGAYEAALLSVLARNGKQCAVTRSFPYPEAYSIDFIFRCE